MAEKSRLSVTLSPADLDRLLEHADEQCTSVAALVRQAVREFLRLHHSGAERTRVVQTRQQASRRR